MTVTVRGAAAASGLQTLVRTFFPFQLETHPVTVTPNPQNLKDKKKAKSRTQFLIWSMHQCRPSSQLNPILFRYSSQAQSADEEFDLVCSATCSADSFLEAMFLLRLFQIPAASKFSDPRP